MKTVTAVGHKSTCYQLRTDEPAPGQAIGVITARPSLDEEALAPHRLYGALEPDDYCTAARWRDMALAEIKFQLHALQFSPMPMTLFSKAGEILK